MKNSFIISILPLVLFLLIKTKKVFHMLQQNRYNDGNRYLKWIGKNYKKVFFNLDMLFIPFIILSLVIESSTMMYIYCALYLIISYFYRRDIKREQLKKPLVFTKRVKRLSFTLGILYLIPFIIILKNFDAENIKLYYVILSVMVYLDYMLAYIANIINKPVEKLVYLYYWTLAHNKLKTMTNMETIGITGSYGKTSSKNIVSEILNVKYNAFPTPKNFNTPYGLANTVNNYLDKFSDYFIAEMGAIRVHEIGDCCKLVKPKYGIITRIGTAHLESFGSKKNIENTKFELIESLPEDGMGILNGDDEIQMNHKIKNNCKIMTIGVDNHDVDCYATDIKLSYKGTSFNVVFKGDSNKYPFETCLLGRASVYNILTGVLLGKYFGMNIEQLQLGVRNVKPTEHRLELKKNGDIAIIDDSYNSNPVGSKMAAEVLGMMPGKTIMVTPGMIELGSEQYEANKLFGTYIADSKIDEVILIGEKQTKPIYDGLMEKNYDEKHIHVLNDIKLAFPLIKELKGKETYVLLENDLPDVFNE